MYHANFMKLLFSRHDQLFRIREAEEMKNLRKTSVLLVLLSIIIYGWSGYLGIGTDIISSKAGSLSGMEYEQSKFWFTLGRMSFGFLLGLFLMLFLPFILKVLTEIPYLKLVLMQQVVLFVLLMERVIWIPLFLNFGLDWFVSPFSFGIIASYFTKIPWIIAFFGAISLFQIWIIWFQVTYITALSSLKKQWIWLTVVLLHIFYWLLVSFLVFIDISYVSRWFN